MDGDADGPGAAAVAPAEPSDRPVAPDRAAYAVLDFETGGLDPNTSALCSVGLVLLDDQLIEVARYHRTIKDEPGKEYTERAMEVNGLDVEALQRDGTPVAEVLDFLRRTLPGKAVVCHNAPFDLGFLAARGLEIKEAICTLELAQRFWRSGRNRLGDVAARLGAERGPAHDALGDVVTTANVLRKFSKMSGIGPLLPRPVRF